MNFDQDFIYFPEMDTIEGKQFDKKVVGIISKDGVFYLKDKKEMNRIHKSFYTLCLNRFNNLSDKSTRYNSEPKHDTNERDKFIPQICK